MGSATSAAPRIAMSRAATILVAGAGLALVLACAQAGAFPRDRTPPTRPTNLRVTAATSYTVSLAWNASSDNSGSFNYRVRHSSGYEATVPQTQTTYTWTTNLEAGRSYSFYVYAVDAAGNRSANSNTVSVTLPADRSPPTRPVVTVTDVGTNYVSLSWSSQEDGPYVWFYVYQDGVAVLQGTRETSGTFGLLEPSTTYTFTVRARDFGMNWSPPSDPVIVTTDALDGSDTTPPTPISNLNTAGMYWPDGETWLFWTQSTDDTTPQSLIQYDVYVNGVLDHSLVGRGSTILYGNPNSLNTIAIIAVDTSGNESVPVSIVVDNR